MKVWKFWKDFMKEETREFLNKWEINLEKETRMMEQINNKLQKIRKIDFKQLFMSFF